MPVLCPSCDREPGPTELAGSACPCGGQLMSVIEPVDPLIGKLVDNRFEVTGRIGAGAMGTVYRAVQKSIGREIALKLIHAQYAGDMAAVKRFFREAQVASRLAHPNTVGVIEFGQDGDGTLYLAMELVRGRTLHDVLEADGALPLSRLVRIGTQLCDALEAAHALAIVHRDLKLENVMVLDGGRDLIKVLDFGLARALGDPALHQTTVGLVSGSPRYMAPELGLTGAAPAPSHDMYSLGVCLAELAAGGALWSSPTLEGLFASKLDPTPVLEQVPIVLRPLVGSLLDPEGAHRPAAADVRAQLIALESIAAPPPTIPPPSGRMATEPTLPLVPAQPVQTQALTLDLDPTETDGIAHGLDRLELVAIDGSIPEPPKPAVVGPPPVDPVAAVKLELDPQWVARRVRQSKSPYEPPPQVVPLPRRESSSAGWVIVGLLLIAAGGGAIYYFNQPAQKPPTTTPSR
ncbi:MAG TPA: serine/threonine-protein kinase [Kofleriaceae bacterium]